MSSPDLRRYSVTTFEPGARLVFTHGLRVRPRSTAFLASSPAPIITLGLDVLVQLVIAATTTAPWSRPSMIAVGASSTATLDPEGADEGLAFALDIIELSAAWNPV